MGSDGGCEIGKGGGGVAPQSAAADSGQEVSGVELQHGNRVNSADG